ncbi:MAG: sugar ABC transporter ATP-binding protein [Beutenbergiaceae bacterium]
MVDDQQPDIVLEMEGIRKGFPGVQALDGVSLTLRRGECHALAGENGAGKSTLMKILSGAYTKDEGSIFIEGQMVNAATPAEMTAMGVVVIYQELTLATHLTVAENIFLGRMPRTRLGLIDWKTAAELSRQAFERLGVDIDPGTVTGELSIAEMQMVEIAKALTQDAKILVLDEPSAVLGDKEISRLFEIVRSLQSEGVSFFYISHRLKEIFEIAQHVTILRDGMTVATGRTQEFDTDRLVASMVGRELENVYPPRDRETGEVVLEAEGLLRAPMVNNVSLSVRAGEIVGIAGLAGAGRTEILRVLAGADRRTAGTIVVRGTPRRISAPKEAIQLGVGFLPEDRKAQGLFLKHTVRFNMSIGNLKRYSAGPILRLPKEAEQANRFSKELRVRASSVEAIVGGLSGGNQQKCVLGRWLMADSGILLADEPTRGVDIGAKQDIYRLLDEFARQGMAVIFVSSELPEILGLADRILVVRNGEISAELDGHTATEEEIMRHATDAEGGAVSSRSR